MATTERIIEFPASSLGKWARQAFRAKVQARLDIMHRTCAALDCLADDLSGARRCWLAAEIDGCLRGPEFLDMYLLESLVVRRMSRRYDCPALFPSSIRLSSVLRESRRIRAALDQSAAEVLQGLKIIEADRTPPRPIEFIIAVLQLAELTRGYATWWEEKLLPLAEKRLGGSDWEELAAPFEAIASG